MMNRENRWKKYSEKELSELHALAESYKAFLDSSKTERECVRESVKLAEAAGWRSLDEVMKKGEKLKAGDKVYAVWMKKTLALFTIGRRPLDMGMRILGAHIDSPRLDLKQNPLYEDTEMAYLDLHYYGGIKKYQWTAIPLAIHGVVAKKDGTVTEIVVGEDDSDPVFCITDLLIHLASSQMEKTLAKGVEGEDLDLLVGSRPLTSEGKDACAAEDQKDNSCADDRKDAEEIKEAVRSMVLSVLKDKYGMEEEDFLSSELEVVPALKARDLGFDRSMVAAYGQDDKVCAYTSLEAFLQVTDPEVTSCCLLTDKEEIGSVGATGARSHFFENTVADLMDACGVFSELNLRRCLARSRMLSSDVSAAYDPLYAFAYEKRNSAYFGKGIVYNKYTGSRGKSGSNDANAEYFGWVRRVMDDADVAFQTAELGRVDMGGGGTIAYISALYGMDVIDAGVAVLNMHAPMEVTSKADIYETRNAYIAFLTAKD